jgi:malate dehydrogenase
MAKISFIGAGNVGATCAQYVAELNVADVVLVDIPIKIEGDDEPMRVAEGKALDLASAGPIRGYDVNVTGVSADPEGDGHEYAAIADSVVVVVTAGLPRKPGMSRDDLVAINKKIIGGIGARIKEHAPDSVVITVTNPLDAMVHVMQEATGFPRERCFGQAGVLDTARFRTFLAWEIGCSRGQIQAMVLGGHGDQMVPLVSTATASGIPITQLVEAGKLAKIVDRTRKGGGEVVKLLRRGSAFYAPGAATAEMVESVLLNQDKILPCSVELQGEYGLEGIPFGVPCKLGTGGIKQVIESELSADEKAELESSAAAVREVVASV